MDSNIRQFESNVSDFRCTVQWVSYRIFIKADCWIHLWLIYIWFHNVFEHSVYLLRYMRHILKKFKWLESSRTRHISEYFVGNTILCPRAGAKCQLEVDKCVSYQYKLAANRQSVFSKFAWNWGLEDFLLRLDKLKYRLLRCKSSLLKRVEHFN